MDPLEQKIRDAFIQIPFGDSNLLESDVIYSLEVLGTKANVVLVIGKDNESFISSTAKSVEDALQGMDEIEAVTIKVMESVDEAEQKERPTGPSERPPSAGSPQQGGHAAPPKQVSYLGEYDNVILVASGKGGVGKSTTTVNLALALKSLGKEVSILDADIYGPSLPVMMGTRGEQPEVIGNQIQPMSRFGVEFISLGNLVPEEESLIWRGPMAHQAIEQLLRDTTWPGGDYMIIDLPPGTGDVQISLAQMTQAAGAVIVCTPQDVALLDARKATAMFDKVNIPILGMIENMSFFKCPGCGEETPIFSTGGTENEAKLQEVEFLGKMPIELNIRVCGDAGDPIVNAYPKSPSALAYVEIAKTLDKALEE